jgi:hypothetical protein
LTAPAWAGYADTQVATHYKQPSSINGVSAGLFLLVALTAWVGWSAWPLIALNSGVKNELNDFLPKVYRANLRMEPAATAETDELHEDLIGRLKAIGVTDPNLIVDISRSEKKVAIVARYTVTMVLKWVGKKYPYTLHPRVETDAARVEW